MLVAAACTPDGGEPGPEPTSTTVDRDPTTAPAPEEGDDAAVEPEPEVDLAACADVELRDGATVDGAVLADCIVAGAVRAGSFRTVVTTSDGETVMRIRLEPELSMVRESGEGGSVVVHGERAWVLDALGWVEADPQSTDAREAIAGTIATVARVAAHPESMSEGISSVGPYTVAGMVQVATHDGQQVDVWELRGATPATVMDVVIDEYLIWMFPDRTVHAQSGTATGFGITETTRNEFLEWGVDPDIPSVEEMEDLVATTD